MAVRNLFVFLTCVLVLLAGCTTAPKFSLHQSLSQSPHYGLPKKVLMVSPDIRVSEISAGGVIEKVDDWSNQAKTHVLNALRRKTGAKGLFELMDLPQFSVQEKAILDQHVALYDVVAGNAFTYGRSLEPAWAHKHKEFDYTLGNGLASLSERTGAEAALIIVGQDFISSKERKVTIVLGALFGVGLPGGPTFVSAGVVDLKTGNLLWFNYDFTVATRDMREAKDVDEIIEAIFNEYPGNKPDQAETK